MHMPAFIQSSLPLLVCSLGSTTEEVSALVAAITGRSLPATGQQPRSLACSFHLLFCQLEDVCSPSSVFAAISYYSQEYVGYLWEAGMPAQMREPHIAGRLLACISIPTYTI
jgi:hypothetical protein